MQIQDPQALTNFDFLARSFAHMQALGQPVRYPRNNGKYERAAGRLVSGTL
ncbi:glycogen synthesis protein GlgS [Kluyvera cryocrescens]|uniref:Glycogen synthesis protein GlgS n=1 Tax=Kluyvera cryocrescens TaxID=580 RepID=A0A485D529_KLUCR|nr:glycogen synthesis protein GlgS [Kluyvera cryocrescens]